MANLFVKPLMECGSTGTVVLTYDLLKYSQQVIVLFFYGNRC